MSSVGPRCRVAARTFEQGTLVSIMPNYLLGPNPEEVRLWLRFPPVAPRAGYQPDNPSSAPYPGRLPSAHVEPVEEVGRGDHEDERRETPLVIVAGRRVPDLVGDRVGPVAEPGHRLGERQRGPFGLGIIRSLPPGRHGEEPLVALARLPRLAPAAVHARAAAVDLADPQVHEFERGLRHAASADGPEQVLDRLHGLGNDHRGVRHSGGQGVHDGVLRCRERLPPDPPDPKSVTTAKPAPLAGPTGRHFPRKPDSGPISPISITIRARSPSRNAMKPRIQCVQTQWIPGFITPGRHPAAGRSS